MFVNNFGMLNEFDEFNSQNQFSYIVVLLSVNTKLNTIPDLPNQEGFTYITNIDPLDSKKKTYNRQEIRENR